MYTGMGWTPHGHHGHGHHGGGGHYGGGFIGPAVAVDQTPEVQLVQVAAPETDTLGVPKWALWGAGLLALFLAFGRKGGA